MPALRYCIGCFFSLLLKYRTEELKAGSISAHGLRVWLIMAGRSWPQEEGSEHQRFLLSGVSPFLLQSGPIFPWSEGSQSCDTYSHFLENESEPILFILKLHLVISCSDRLVWRNPTTWFLPGSYCYIGQIHITYIVMIILFFSLKIIIY